MNYLQCGSFRLSLARPLVMGIVNVTPDSFSDGAMYAQTDTALEHARKLIDEGADILDIGGESARPGSAPVDVDEELARVLPVIEGLHGARLPICVDTCKPDVMRAVLKRGVSMVNDVNALLANGALEAVAGSGVAVCLMHKRGEPKTMQEDPHYADVVAEVKAFLRGRIAAARAAGIEAARIAIDPGFGFGKTLGHNLELLRSLDKFAALGAVVLAGISRKATLGQITGRAVGERVHASVAAALIAVQNGARIVRVHEVAATRDALAVWQAVRGEEC